LFFLVLVFLIKYGQPAPPPPPTHTHTHTHTHTYTHTHTTHHTPKLVVKLAESRRLYSGVLDGIRSILPKALTMSLLLLGCTRRCSCRTPLSTRRVLRADGDIDRLIAKLYPDRDSLDVEMETLVEEIVASDATRARAAAASAPGLGAAHSYRQLRPSQVAYGAVGALTGVKLIRHWPGGSPSRHVCWQSRSAPLSHGCKVNPKLNAVSLARNKRVRMAHACRSFGRFLVVQSALRVGPCSAGNASRSIMERLAKQEEKNSTASASVSFAPRASSSSSPAPRRAVRVELLPRLPCPLTPVPTWAAPT
jgi:hypothetical protein